MPQHLGQKRASRTFQVSGNWDVEEEVAVLLHLQPVRLVVALPLPAELHRRAARLLVLLLPELAEAVEAARVAVAASAVEAARPADSEAAVVVLAAALLVAAVNRLKRRKQVLRRRLSPMRDKECRGGFLFSPGPT